MKQEESQRGLGKGLGNKVTQAAQIKEKGENTPISIWQRCQR